MARAKVPRTRASFTLFRHFLMQDGGDLTRARARREELQTTCGVLRPRLFYPHSVITLSNIYYLWPLTEGEYTRQDNARASQSIHGMQHFNEFQNSNCEQAQSKHPTSSNFWLVPELTIEILSHFRKYKSLPKVPSKATYNNKSVPGKYETSTSTVSFIGRLMQYLLIWAVRVLDNGAYHSQK